jgi:hypothetical protein
LQVAFFFFFFWPLFHLSHGATRSPNPWQVHSPLQRGLGAMPVAR